MHQSQTSPLRSVTAAAASSKPQKAALKGTPYDPDVLAEKMKAPEENP